MNTQTLKTKRKRRASTNAIREIKKEQNKTSTIIPVSYTHLTLPTKRIV